MSKESEAPRIALILAGGAARRMGGVDKGAIELGCMRLFDRVIERLSPQVDRIVVSGTHDYDSGYSVIADLEDGPHGPAAGLWAMLEWLRAHHADDEGFLTVPIDAPFLPLDLYERLHSAEHSSIACDANGAHPTFAYWRCDALRAALQGASNHYGLPLKELAKSVNARRIRFDTAGEFENINRPDDLQRAAARLRS